MNPTTNYTEYESWHTDMDSSGGGLDNSADSNLSSNDNDRINSSRDNLLKSSSTTTIGNKFNYVSQITISNIRRFFFFLINFPIYRLVTDVVVPYMIVRLITMMS